MPEYRTRRESIEERLPFTETAIKRAGENLYKGVEEALQMAFGLVMAVLSIGLLILLGYVIFSVSGGLGIIIVLMLAPVTLLALVAIFAAIKGT